MIVPKHFGVLDVPLSCCLNTMWCSHSYVDGADHHQSVSPPAEHRPWSPEFVTSNAELDARLAQYEGRTEEEEDEEDEQERIPDLQKDDMMARRTGVFHKQSSAAVTYNHFLPPPASRHSTQSVDSVDAAPRSKKQVQVDRSQRLNVRWGESCVVVCLTVCGGQ